MHRCRYMCDTPHPGVSSVCTGDAAARAGRIAVGRLDVWVDYAVSDRTGEDLEPTPTSPNPSPNPSLNLKRARGSDHR